MDWPKCNSLCWKTSCKNISSITLSKNICPHLKTSKPSPDNDRNQYKYIIDNLIAFSSKASYHTNHDASLCLWILTFSMNQYTHMQRKPYLLFSLHWIIVYSITCCKLYCSTNFQIFLFFPYTLRIGCIFHIFHSRYSMPQIYMGKGTTHSTIKHCLSTCIHPMLWPPSKAYSKKN